MTATTQTTVHDTTAGDSLLRDYHDARRREDQWRIPQLLLALAAPVLTLLTVIFNMSGSDNLANVAGAVAIVAGAGAALLAIEVWRWHRTAVSHLNVLRTDHPEAHARAMQDPL